MSLYFTTSLISALIHNKMTQSCSKFYGVFPLNELIPRFPYLGFTVEATVGSLSLWTR